MSKSPSAVANAGNGKSAIRRQRAASGPATRVRARASSRASATTEAPLPKRRSPLPALAGESVPADAPADLSSERLSGQFALGRHGDFRPRDLIRTAGNVARQARRRPVALMRATAGLAAEMLKVARGESTLEPESGDKRFADSAWQQSWFHRTWMKGYLAQRQALQGYAKLAAEDPMQAQRAGFLMMQLTEAMAPTNMLLGNPAALRKFIDTGGASLMRGMTNLYGDIAAGRVLPAQSDDSSFKLGGNLAATPGHVVLRTEMFELLQYAPQTTQVHRRPILVVPSIVNKYYVFDLAPGRSVIEHFVKQGLTMFVMVWRNPRPEHDHWGIAQYQESIDQAIDAAAEICDVPDVNLWGVCGAGPVVTSLVGHYAATGQRKANSLMLVVSPHDMSRQNDIPGIGAFKDPKLTKRLKPMPSRRLSANDFSLLFGMLRPNDLIWNYWVNNYLMGNDPPTFDILTWNNDGTGMTASFNRDFGELGKKNPLVTPGAMQVRGQPIADLAQLGIDSYVLGAMTDHLCLWQDVYRTAQLLGERSQFVLGSSGHIQTIVNPPGNPKTSFLTNLDKPAAAEDWLAAATKHSGSWWDHCVAWTAERSADLVDAPGKPGSRKHPALGKAPGTYVLEKV
jgi:polyhydroxyalkanoate synthase